MSLSLFKTGRTVLQKRNLSLQSWQASQSQLVTTHDEISGSLMNLLGNTLGRQATVPTAGTVLPPCWHHIYFPPRTAESDLAADGYETDFFPPSFSQRMWAGARLDWSTTNPLRVGDQARMETGLERVDEKVGRYGASAMVWIKKEIWNEAGWSMRERRCLVYLTEQPKGVVETRGIQIKKKADFQKTIIPSSILLFRYSALTFNSHKIHFDHEYATKVEHHPGCLVHGPLSSTLLVEFLREQLSGKGLSSFEYKCLTPLYVNQPMTLAGRKTNDGYELWITNHLNHLAVKGSATLA